MGKMMEVPTLENDIITFRRIRSAIGVLGIGLPIVLVILPAIEVFDTSVQPSISHFYYTNFRELFTGVLCAVGLFLIRYRGHKNPVIWKNDSLLTNIAGVMAFGIAIFPTNPDYCSQKVYSLLPFCNGFLGGLHYAFAAVFFVVLAIISINVFTIGQHDNAEIPISMFNENRIYKTCGWFILLFVALVPVLAHYEVSYGTLICEALALFSFGFSWLIKGRALGDKGMTGRMIYRENN
jgi:hypothetical protein